MTLALADLPRRDDDGALASSPRGDFPKRRVFPAEYKAAILAEYDAAEHGQRGAILRREGLYSSHIIDWRRSAAGSPRSADRRRESSRRDREIEALRARAERAEAELARAQAALEIVGKAHALLELLSESADTPTRSRK